MSLVELVIDYGGLADDGEAIIEPTLFRTIRIFRLTRMLKLVPHCEGLGLIVSASCSRQIHLFKKLTCAVLLQFRTFLESVPLISNVAILLTIVFFVYTVLAVQMFGLVAPSDQEMNDLMNFQNFGRAWWTLFVLSTGEHWNACVATPEAPQTPCLLCG